MTASAALQQPRELGARDVAGYRVLRSLARDEQAEVLLGHRTADGGAHTVAIKTWPASDDNWTIALRSCAALDLARGDHVVELRDLDADDDGIHLIFERLPRGDLAGLLRDRPRLDAGEAVTVLAPIAMTVLRLHRVGVAHGRVGAGSVLFRDDGAPTLIGFSRAELFAPDAPEIMLEQIAAVRRDRVAARVVATSVLGRVEGARAHAARALMADLSGCADELVLPLLASRLFELAAALPVRFSVDDEEPEIAPSQWRQIPVGAPVSGAVDDVDAASTRRQRSGRVVAALGRVVPEPLLARLVDAVRRSALAPVVAKAARAARQRWRSWTPGRRRIVLAIAAGAATVGIVTAALPSTTAAPARSTVTAAPATAGQTTGTQPGRDTADESTVDDPVTAAGWLVEARDRCLSTLSLRCLDGVDESRSGAMRDDQTAIRAAQHGGELPDAFASPSPSPGGHGALVLIERLGDSALVGLGETASGASILLIRADGAWRIRDVLRVGGAQSTPPGAAPTGG